jgi:hypothetical protein
LNLIRVMPAKGQDTMATSIFLAQLIGPVALAIGLSLMLNAAVFRALAEQFLGNHALIFILGIVTLPAGLAIVLTHNVWAADWRLLITLIGWLATIAGAIRLIAPQQAAAMGGSSLRSAATLKVSAAAYLAVGAVLCFFGYVA